MSRKPRRRSHRASQGQKTPDRTNGKRGNCTLNQRGGGAADVGRRTLGRGKERLAKPSQSVFSHGFSGGSSKDAGLLRQTLRDLGEPEPLPPTHRCRMPEPWSLCSVCQHLAICVFFFLTPGPSADASDNAELVLSAANAARRGASSAESLQSLQRAAWSG